MISPRHSLVVFLCLVHVTYFTSAFLRRSSLHKRFGQIPGSQESSDHLGSKLSFKGEGFEPETFGTRYGSIVLECEAVGSPAPTIHWLKDGVRISQGTSQNVRDDEASYEDHRVGGKNVLRLSNTHSKLFLDCLTANDEAKYTCVAENALIRKSQTTYLKVEEPENIKLSNIHKCVGRKAKRGEPARIYMWTVSRLEYENNRVQIFCRAQGNPQPNIVWYDRDNRPIADDENYRTADNGDLIIRDITWLENMGVYTCTAENRHGTDSTETFLYPTARGDDFGFPL